MVRYKTRWLLVRVDRREEHVGSSDRDGKTPSSSSSATVISKREIISAIRENLVAMMGIRVAGVAMDTHVRFWDDVHTHLMLIRVPRDVLPVVRASMAHISSLGIGGDPQKITTRRNVIALSTLSVHGSARTAKRATIREIRNYYRAKSLDLRRQSVPSTLPDTARLCAHMDDSLQQLQAIDF